MQITKTNVSPTELKLTISATEAELLPVKDHVLRSHFADVKVPGFREGRAPLNLVEKSIDQRRFADEFMEHAINELYQRAIEQEALRPVGQPKIELKKFVPYTLLEFETTQQVIGKVSLPNYKSIKLVKPKVTVTAQDVNDVLKNLQRRMAERNQVSRPSKLGDEALIDFKGTDEAGEAIAGADGKDYPLVLGSKSFIPGFEEEVVGLAAGDKKQFRITFPKDYPVGALQSKKVNFAIEAKAVSELKEPKLDDEFAKKSGPFKTVVELKADVKRQLELERQAQAQREYENDLIRKIASKTQVEIPESMVDEQLERMEADEKQNLAYRGQTWQEHLKEEGVSEGEHRERHRPEAIERVKGGLVLSEVAVKENLEVSEDELNERIAQLKQQYQDEAMQAELDKPANRQDIVSRILTEKTIERLVKYANS